MLLSTSPAIECNFSFRPTKSWVSMNMKENSVIEWWNFYRIKFPSSTGSIWLSFIRRPVPCDFLTCRVVKDDLCRDSITIFYFLPIWFINGRLMWRHSCAIFTWECWSTSHIILWFKKFSYFYDKFFALYTNIIFTQLNNQKL